MTVWLVRAGKHGEFEQKFLQENKVYVTWDKLAVDLGKMKERQQLFDAMSEIYPEAKTRAIQQNVSQVWPFGHEMQPGDLIVMPSKMQRAIYVAEITGGYQFEKQGPDPFFHSRTVKWIGEAIPRSNFGQDLLHSFGAFTTICRITRNNAAERIAIMRKNGWKPETAQAVTKAPSVQDDAIAEDSSAQLDIEDTARDQIANLIQARFAGHGLTRLVDAILRAQGYTTYVSPEGADGGVDILAGSSPLGFGTPRLCVEVKSESGPMDRPSVDKLLGAMTKFGAQEGLFVSWSGFKKNVQRELAPTFFRVRLWTQNELFEALFDNYEKLDAEIKAELPLKRIWTLALKDEDEA
jgi:restriction system protein